MFTINIDEDGYYAEGSDGTLVEVTEIPDVKDTILLKAYKYENNELIVDSDKYKSIEKTLPKSSQITKEEKKEEIDLICSETIYAGTDVKLKDGTVKHFSMTQNDQLNILGIQMMLANGMDTVPYHADGEECTYYSAEDMNTIIQTIFAYKTWHTTYCNLLHLTLNETSDDDVENIVYGMPLPEQYDSKLVEITGVSSRNE